MAEIHYFDIHIAEMYGVNCAVILQNIWHWVKKNEANGTNFYDGNYWTYNSTKAFQKLFPYLSQKQIETALKKLRDENILITGNYNTLKYDRTLWYAITEKGKSILLTGEMEITEKGNGNTPQGKPIPNINTDSKTPNNNTDINTLNIDSEFEILWKLYPRKLGKPKALKAYQKARRNGVTFEQVERGIKAYCKQIEKQKTEIEYVKHGSTWFNGECWNDEYNTGSNSTPQKPQKYELKGGINL